MIPRTTGSDAPGLGSGSQRGPGLRFRELLKFPEIKQQQQEEEKPKDQPNKQKLRPLQNF